MSGEEAVVMRSRVLGRAAALAAAVSLAVAGGASADSLAADGDSLAVGAQGTIDVGVVAPGTELGLPVAFLLTCTGTNHLDADQVVSVALVAATVPDGGAAGATGVSFPTPPGWPADEQGCASPTQVWTTPTAMLTITAPAAAGGPYAYDLLFRVSSASSLAGISTYVEAHVVLSVGTDEPPVLHLPGDVSVVTADPAGAQVTFVVGATDGEDDVDPAVVCAPPSGSWFPVGTTAVECAATDSAGQRVTGSFSVSVVLDAPVTAVLEAPIPQGLRRVVPAGRTLPLKVRLEQSGELVTAGRVDAVGSGCTGTQRTAPTELTISGGRWTALLRVAALNGCDRVDVRLDGRVVGGFALAAFDPSSQGVDRTSR
jgi:hypothetical protein